MWGNRCYSFEFCRTLLKGWLGNRKIHPTKTRLFSLFLGLLSFGLLGPGEEESRLPVSAVCLLNLYFFILFDLFNSPSSASAVNTAQGLRAHEVLQSTCFLLLRRAEEASGKCRTEKPASERSFPDQDPGVPQGVLHTNRVPDRHHN